MSILEEFHENEIVNRIKEIQDNYYSKNKKNTIFKNKQKLDCANAVCNAIPIDFLISQTIYIIPNTDKIFLDYTIFKLFANTDNFNQIIDNIFVTIKKCVESFSTFEIYINLDSFTVSALERYKVVIKDFINKCISSNTRYSENIINLYICNVPKTFDAIIKTMKPFIEKQVYEKIKLYDDSTSKQTIAEFHSYRDSLTS
uniref:CRAL-TRIO domain-containing protein n=1 Tax=viral metagenome TaxID=1070528 RepID=A0A6C0HS04_9ZZZZ